MIEYNLFLDGITVMLSNIFKKLGIVFDSNLYFAIAFFHLATLRHLLSLSDAEKPINVVILKTNYHNVLPEVQLV